MNDIWLSNFPQSLVEFLALEDSNLGLFQLSTVNDSPLNHLHFLITRLGTLSSITLLLFLRASVELCYERDFGGDSTNDRLQAWTHLPVRYLEVLLVTRKLTDANCAPLVEKITSRIIH